MLKLTKYAHDSIPLLEVIIYLLCSYEARAFGFISHFYRKCLKTFLIYIAMKYVFRQLNIKTIKREVLHCDSHYNLYRIDFMAWY